MNIRNRLTRKLGDKKVTALTEFFFISHTHTHKHTHTQTHTHTNTHTHTHT